MAIAWKMQRGPVDGKKRPSLFWTWYLRITLAFVGLLFIGLVVVWFALGDYQESIPSGVMDQVISTLQEQESPAWMRNAVRKGCSEFEDPVVVQDYLFQGAEGKSLSYERAFSPDRIANPTFTVLAGNEELAQVVLRRQSVTSTFGFSLYEVDRIVPLAESKGSLSFLLPASYSAYINGIVVPSSYCTEEGVDLPNGDLLCGNWAASGKGARYEVKDLLETPVVAIKNSDGEEVQMQQDPETGDLSVAWQEWFIEAPASAQIFVNGEEITGQKDFIQEEDLQPEGLRDIPLGSYSQEYYVRYRVLDASVAPTVLARLGDSEGVVRREEEENCFRVSYTASAEEQKSYEQFALEFAKKYSLYVTQDGSKTQVLKSMLSGTPMYKRLKDDFYAGFFTSHDDTGFRDEKVSDFVLHHSKYYSCVVSYVQWVEGFVGNPELSKDYPSSFTVHVVFVEEQQKWLVADFEIQDM